MTQRGEDVESKFILTGQNNTAKAFGEAAKNLKMLGGQAMQTDKLFKSMMGGQRGAGAQRGGFPMMRMGMAGAAFGAGRYLRNQIGKADQITDLADSMGVSPETAQTLRVLSRDTSVSFEGLGRTFAKLNDGMVEAQADPEGGIAESFSLIGLSADRLKEMNVEQVFERLSRVMADSRTPAFQLKAAQDLLGGSATKLNAIYQQVGSQGFEALNAAMIKSGRIIDQEGITKLAQLEGKLEEIQDKASIATMNTMINAMDTGKGGNFVTRMVPKATNQFLQNSFEKMFNFTARMGGDPAVLKPFVQDKAAPMSKEESYADRETAIAIEKMSDRVVGKLSELNQTAKGGSVWK